MANETRLRANYVSGVVDNNPLSNSGTSLVSTELAALPAVDATQHIVLVLDPDGAGNGPEIVYVTAHTASSTGATIVRGREGSSGVSHASTRTWVHGPVVSDYVNHVTAATRPSTGGLPFEGQRIYETDTNTLLYYNGTAWVIESEPAQAYTPTLTQSATVTKTVDEGTYQRSNGRCRGNARLAVTGAGTINNQIRVGLPVAHDHPAGVVIGTFLAYDANATTFFTGVLVTQGASGGTVAIMAQDGNLSQSYLGELGAQFTLASSDVVTYFFDYKTT